MKKKDRGFVKCAASETQKTTSKREIKKKSRRHAALKKKNAKSRLKKKKNPMGSEVILSKPRNHLDKKVRCGGGKALMRAMHWKKGKRTYFRESKVGGAGEPSSSSDPTTNNEKKNQVHSQPMKNIGGVWARGKIEKGARRV